jgi:hypothetical protein
VSDDKQAEIDRLTKKLARLALLSEHFTDAVQRAVTEMQNRGKGGQHVPFHGDFASAPPSTLSRLGWWAREFRMATSERTIALAESVDP